MHRPSSSSMAVNDILCSCANNWIAEQHQHLGLHLSWTLRVKKETHLFKSRCMMGCVRLWRYSMPLATSTAMINLDCRSRVLYFGKKTPNLKVNKQTRIICKLLLSVNCGKPVDSPLLLVQQGEEWPAGDVLRDNGELAGVVQAGTHKLDDTRVVQPAQDGHFTAEHVHVRFGAVGIGPIA